VARRKGAPKDRTAGPQSARADRRLVALLAATIVIAGIWAYSNSFDGVLVLDDPGAITWNPSIRSLTGAFSPPPGTSVSGRPIANVSFAINYLISGTDLWSYHAVNLAIHVAAALTLFGVLRRTLSVSSFPPSRSALRWASPSCPLWFAWSVSMVWIVHPLHTEAVTYIVQRIEALTALFLMLTIYCAIRAGDASGGWNRWSTAAMVFCALGMATKEVMVVTPILVWLWYRTFRSQVKYPRVVLALPVTWIILVVLLSGAPRGQTAGFGLAGWTPWMYLLTQAEVVTHYLDLVVWPSPLVFHYAWPRVESVTEVLPEAGFLVLLVLSTIWALIRRHPLGFAGACFFGVLAPTSSIVPVVTQIAAEHRMYVPAAAVLSVILAGGMFAGRLIFRGRQRAALGIGCGGVVILTALLGAATRDRNRDYASAEALWHDTVIHEPDSPRAQLGYSLELVDRRRFAEAEPHARAAVAIEPENPLAHRTLGFALAGQNKAMEALTELRRALGLFPDDLVAKRAVVQIHSALASAYADAGRFEQAVAEVDAALAVASDPGQISELTDRRARYLARSR
jgi:hypothetical protein